MHEATVAAQIIATISRSMKKSGTNIQRVKRIYVTIGVLSAVDKESLINAFAAIKKPELFATSRLVVREHILEVFCNSCNASTIIKEGYTLRCGKCDKPTADIRKGKELTVDRISY